MSGLLKVWVVDECSFPNFVLPVHSEANPETECVVTFIALDIAETSSGISIF